MIEDDFDLDEIVVRRVDGKPKAPKPMWVTHALQRLQRDGTVPRTSLNEGEQAAFKLLAVRGLCVFDREADAFRLTLMENYVPI